MSKEKMQRRFDWQSYIGEPVFVIDWSFDKNKFEVLEERMSKDLIREEDIFNLFFQDFYFSEKEAPELLSKALTAVTLKVLSEYKEPSDTDFQDGEFCHYLRFSTMDGAFVRVKERYHADILGWNRLVDKRIYRDESKVCELQRRLNKAIKIDSDVLFWAAFKKWKKSWDETREARMELNRQLAELEEQLKQND